MPRRERADHGRQVVPNGGSFALLKIRTVERETLAASARSDCESFIPKLKPQLIPLAQCFLGVTAT